MIKKIIITLFFLFTLFVFNNQYQAKAEDEENTTSTSTPPAPILIISSTDNDFGNTIYNSEDKNKLFGCFNFWASSSEDVLLKDITLLVRDSFSSNFINPEVEKNIYNIKLIDSERKEIQSSQNRHNIRQHQSYWIRL